MEENNAKNRIISWLTILTLMLTAIPQFGGVAAADMPISEVTLAYFGNGEIEGASVMDKGYPTKENVCTRAKLDTSVTYEDAGSSLVWQFGSHNGVLVKIPYNSAWESECDKFNIRFYSEFPGQTITMLVNEYDTFRSSDDNKYYNGLPTTGDGWQVMSVDISAIKNFWVVNEPEFIYVLLISGWSTTVGSAGDFESGKVNAITGEKNVYRQNLAFQFKIRCTHGFACSVCGK